MADHFLLFRESFLRDGRRAKKYLAHDAYVGAKWRWLPSRYGAWRFRSRQEADAHASAWPGAQVEPRA